MFGRGEKDPYHASYSRMPTSSRPAPAGGLSSNYSASRPTPAGFAGSGGGAPPTYASRSPAPPSAGYARSTPSPAGGYAAPPRAAGFSNATPHSTYGRGGGGGGGDAGGYGRFSVVMCPQPYVLSNCIVGSSSDWGNAQFILVNRHFVFNLIYDQTGTVPSGSIGTAILQRQWAGLSASGDVVDAESYDPYSMGQDIYLSGLDLEVSFLRRGQEIAEQFDADLMAANFLNAFNGQIFTVGQMLVFEFHGQNLKVVVRGLQVAELQAVEKRGGGGRSAGGGGLGGDKGILMDQTDITFMKAPDSNLKIKSSAKRAPPNAILQPNFKFEDMGIGGLDAEFSAIFRRAFASRVFPPGLVEKLGIQHVKGILLHGPPGTGKTLMARQIGKMLNAREPKIVNGPEVLNKFVGQSEENIRKLFADAEKEYKEKGDESGLHIIIFDELDAICKQRGSTGGGTGVGDSVVNQLLSKMDGVDQLNNILIIGMTNRLDMIDEALLRPGRLEVHMEISLPDEHGRQQILQIQTAKMQTNGVMDADVDLAELAQLTKNFSGAEINGLVKSATSFAFNRHVKVGTLAGISDDIENMKVNRDDFMHALDEVHPAFGVSEEELSAVVENGIMHFAPHIDVILRDGQLRVQQVHTSSRTPLVTVLMHGPPGTGKTALAATIAMSSEFPFIKLVSPENMIGFSEAQKIAYLNKVFSDSYKSPLSVIVVDSIEKILDWTPIGPRFSNGVLQALSVLLGKRPPKGRRLLVLATTSNLPMLGDMDLSETFSTDIRVPPITSLRSLDHVLREVQLFSSDHERERTLRLMESAGYGEDGKLNIGIKKLLSEIEMARLDDDPADKLVSALTQHF